MRILFGCSWDHSAYKKALAVTIGKKLNKKWVLSNIIIVNFDRFGSRIIFKTSFNLL